MVRRYMRAYTEAIHYYKTHKEETMKIMRKYSRLDDRKVLEEAWDWHARFIPEAPYPPPEGYQLVLQDMAATNPKAAQANVKDYVDLRFVKELEDQDLSRISIVSKFATAPEPSDKLLKSPSCEARERRQAKAYNRQYVGARRLSATSSWAWAVCQSFSRAACSTCRIGSTSMTSDDSSTFPPESHQESPPSRPPPEHDRPGSSKTRRQAARHTRIPFGHCLGENFHAAGLAVAQNHR